jgi:hypothetical protein
LYRKELVADRRRLIGSALGNGGGYHTPFWRVNAHRAEAAWG